MVNHSVTKLAVGLRHVRLTDRDRLDFRLGKPLVLLADSGSEVRDSVYRHRWLPFSTRL